MRAIFRICGNESQQSLQLVKKAIYVSENVSDSILHDHATTVADPGEGPGGPGPTASYFWTKLRPEGPKKFIWETTPHPPPPYLRVWMIAPRNPPQPPPPLSQGLDPTPYYINKSWYYDLSVLTEYLADPRGYWFIGIQNGSNITCVI